MANATIIVGQLDKTALEKSIDDLVKNVADKTTIMASTFQTAIDKMNASMKDFAINQKVSVTLMKEAWRDMSSSFDAMIRAQEGERGRAKSPRDPNTVGGLRDEIRSETKLREEMQLGSEELRIQNLELARRKRLLKEQTTARPESIGGVFNMSENTLDGIAQKMQAIRSVQQKMDYRKQGEEMARLNREYARLSTLQKELLGKNALVTNSNDALARSFGYIRNRIIYALTLGTLTSFVRQIYEVRGQYELLERSLGVLTDDMRKGSEIFQELGDMAMKSPFTLIELGTAAKQLTAYNFAAEEVVDTTRRLADISAALGVPMERLTYNLGQIKAQGVLNARDARDFANAGLAIVPMLADLYTKQKRFGDEIVTTSQVYSMMSKKMVTYKDVMQVINQVTDEGGKFFDFQAKQAETLKVKMANLTLAFNNMLNEIGTEHQKTLELPLRGLKLLFENWREVVRIVKIAIATFGGLRVINSLPALFNAWGSSIAFVKNSFVALTTAIKTNPMGMLATGLASLATYYMLFNKNTNEATEYIERFGESGGKVVRNVESLFDSIIGMSHESSNYKRVVGELNSILEDYGIELIKEDDSIKNINEKRKVAIDLIKQETLERKHLNDIQHGRDVFEETAKNAKEDLKEGLQNAITGNFLFRSNNNELRQNAEAISNIVASVVESNISEIAGKTGDEYEAGMDKIYDTIQQRMRAIGISERTISKVWMKQGLIGEQNIVQEYIETIQKAKEANDRYNESQDKAYEAEMQAAGGTSRLRDKIEATRASLMKSANDSDKLYASIDKIIQDYSGQNIIDFKVRVGADVPKWMMDKSVTELSTLAARFAAIVKQGARATGMTQEETAIRAAQYATALKQKQANIESEKTSTITQNASNALKEYKEALEGVKVAQNLVAQGKKEERLVTEKEKEAQEAYNKALDAGVSKQELYEAKNGKNRGGAKKDPLGEALEKETQLITDIQKRYKEYKAIGVDAQEAITLATNEYGNTLIRTNATLKKYGVKTLSSEELSTMPLQEIRAFYQEQLRVANELGNAKGMEALEKTIANLNVEITKIDYKRITDGLNNQLSKLKDEYELAVELDANPELGNMFADMMGLSEEDMRNFPREFAGLASKMQDAIDKELGAGKFTLLDNLNTSKLDDWLKANGIEEGSEVAKSLKSFVDLANKTRVDETKKQIDEWAKLLEKYAEYETKKNKIQQDAEREREIARKKGADKEIIDAINTREARDLAQLDFEEFQKTPTWVQATGDLANLSNSALSLFIKRLEEYKKSAKNLDPKQIRQINKALIQLKKQQRKDNPFSAMANAIADAKERMDEYKPAIEETEKAIETLNEKESESGELSEKESKKREKLIETLKRLKEEQKEAGEISATSIVDSLNQSINAASKAVDMFGELADAIGGKGMTKSAQTMKEVMGIIQKGGEMAAIGAQIGGGWGAAIGAVVGVLQGVVTTYIDKWNGNRAITRGVQESEWNVKRLEAAYVGLEHAVDNAFGTAEIGARQLAIANKELQLQELKRQLVLEESRKEKNKDKDRILDLKVQIEQLEYEIVDASHAIVESLIGISSVGDAVENLVSTIVGALRTGDDAIESFNSSIDDMIANLIIKFASTHILGPMFQEAFDEIDKQVQERSLPIAQQLKAYQSIKDVLDSDYQKLSDFFMRDESGNALFGRDAYEQLNKVITRLEEEYQGASTMTIDDLKNYAQILEDLKLQGGGIVDQINALISDNGLLGTDKGKQLSALQQGIQGITESTAGALEAYMNGVSQQVYYQSDILTQIRDAVVLLDGDVQLGTQAQMLLQLQQSYQVQMSIQSILEGVLNPSGRAFSVELIS